MSADCLVCRERDGDIELPGGFVVDEELVFGFHVVDWERPAEPAYLGHLLICSKRHAPGLADLTDEEAGAIGVAVAQMSRALKAEGADHVFSAVIGTGVPHLHVHLLARYPETPRELEWHRIDEWEGARRGGAKEVAALVARLRGHLQARAAGGPAGGER